jgi:hypothetical protein
MRLLTFFIVGIFLAISLGSSLHKAYTLKCGILREAQWRLDLRRLAIELPRRHKNTFLKVKKKDFEQAVLDLDASIHSMSDSEIRAALMRLAAMIGDSHTYINWSYSDFKVYPLKLYEFKDGLYVISTNEEYKRALGSRLVGIGETDVELASKEIKTMIPYENESCFKLKVPLFLVVHEFLKLTKLIPDQERNHFVFEDAAGKRFTLEMNVMSSNEKVEWIGVLDSSRIEKLLYLRNRDINYLREYLPASKTLFIKYNSCKNMESESFKEFSKDAISFAKSNDVERIIIDLRNNPGGNEGVFKPLIRELRRSGFNRKGRLFAIVGRSTFSAACSNTIELKKKTNLLIVGEPTGEKPNHYGEAKSFRLQNSGLEVNYSTKFWKRVDGDPPALMPDIQVVMSFEDFLMGRDAALETVLSYSAGIK